MTETQAVLPDWAEVLRERHAPVEPHQDMRGDPYWMCPCCDVSWPCDTTRALDALESELASLRAAVEVARECLETWDNTRSDPQDVLMAMDNAARAVSDSES